MKLKVKICAHVSAVSVWHIHKSRLVYHVLGGGACLNKLQCELHKINTANVAVLKQRYGLGT